MRTGFVPFFLLFFFFFKTPSFSNFPREGPPTQHLFAFRIFLQCLLSVFGRVRRYRNSLKKRAFPVYTVLAGENGFPPRNPDICVAPQPEGYDPR